MGVEIRGVPPAPGTYKTPLFFTWGSSGRSPELLPGLQYKKDWTSLTDLLNLKRSKSLTFIS